MTQSPTAVRGVRAVRRAAVRVWTYAIMTTPIVLATSATALAATGDLVVQSVDISQRVAISGHRAAWAKAADDLGPVPADLALGHLTLQLRRSPQRQQAFERLLREQQDPASPNYHQWLTPSEIGARFGASAHDIDAVSAWLTSQGLTVDGVSNDRQRIHFGGRAADVSAAFATPIDRFATRAGERIANTSEPRVPAALAHVVDSVTGLSTIRFEPMHRVGAPQTRSVGTSTGFAPQPAGTNCSAGTCSYVVFPGDFARIYDLGPLQQQSIDGSGQTIAIIARQNVYAPDVTNFQQLAALPVRSFTTTIPPQGSDPGPPASTCSPTGTPSCNNPGDAVNDQGEATIDVQLANSVAPGATINLVTSGTTNSVDGLNIALDYAVDHDPVPGKILSISYASCEADNSQAVADGLDGLFSQAAMEGISVFVASGDGGVAGCASLDAAPSAGEPVSANILCSSSHVTCVGGTEFADGASPGQYWSASNGAGYVSALGYIPEGAWNDPLDSNGNPQAAASGGGVSVYEPTPAWQVGPGVPAARTGRYTPDVSFNASVREGYFTCVAAQGGACTVSAGSFHFIVSGGTSTSAPSMAGVAALLNQKYGVAQGNLNPGLYALAQTPGNGVFHDVTVASSAISPCTLATPSLCNNSTPGPGGLGGGLQGYTVATGYDLATGLGSLDVAHLVAQWSAKLDQHGLTGSWANPATSGQGVLMDVVPDFYGSGTGLLFGGWFTYDSSAAGGQRWYTIQGQVGPADQATMSIYQTLGGRFDSALATTTTPVGSATVAFSDCTHGTLSYAFSDGSGRTGIIPLIRLLPNVTCASSGDNGANAADYLLSGAWADPANSGQGLVFDRNPLNHIFFAAWYTFATSAGTGSGAPGQRWYTLQAATTPGTSAIADVGIYDTSGGVFDATHATTTQRVGTATLSFQSCGAATLNYHFDSGANAGVSGSLALGRVTPAPAGCQL